MDLTNVQAVTEYLVSRGLILHGPIRVTPFSGGVSSDVVLVSNGRQIVLKRALPKLRVQEDWYAGVERSRVEVRCLKKVAESIPGFVPRVLDDDPERAMFAMEYVPGPSWKSRLLAGEVNLELAGEMGRFLAAVHRLSFRSPQWLSPFTDKSLFYQLRVSPYFVFIRDRYPAERGELDRVIDMVMDGGDVLVHGDFSPKNIVLREVDGRPYVLDWEVAHSGHPTFDIGFMITHLLLKAIHFREKGGAYRLAATRFYEAYFEGVGVFAEADLRDAVRRTVGALMLARVDGKSPAEYLTSTDKEEARKIGLGFLTGEIAGWSEFSQ